MTTIEFRLLGPLDVRIDGRPVSLGGPRQRVVLALLLTRPNVVVPRDRLVDELWPEAPPSSAVNVLQTYVSHLRKALPEERIATRAPGYSLRVEPGELDLHRFEALAAAGRDALAAGDAERAARSFRSALELWRGEPLADVVGAAFAQVEAARLEELRLAVLEQRLDAELALGRHAEVVGELEALVSRHPLRERLREQLMLALYRSGRQSDALGAYRAARAALVEELGIEPGASLRELEAAILRQDVGLDPPGSGRVSARAIVAVAFPGEAPERLLGLGEALARRSRHEVVLVCLAPAGAELGEAGRRAAAARAELAARGVHVRSAAFTSGEPGADALRLARDTDAALLLVAAPAAAIDDDGMVDAPLAQLLADAPCDVCALVGGNAALPARDDAPVVVPFGGAAHEWAAAEIGAWIAAGEGRRLLLAGAEADLRRGTRDASRLLASVALLVQQVAHVESDSALVEPGGKGVLDLAAAARAVLVGLPDDWRGRGLGKARTELVHLAQAPVMLVASGLRPGGLAPPGSLTRFTWTLEHPDGPS